MTWFLLLVVLNIADAVTTTIGVKRGAGELNPVMRVLMAKVGTLPALLGWKAAFFGAMFYFLPAIDVRAMMVLCAFYAAVVGWNIFHLRRLKQA